MRAADGLRLRGVVAGYGGPPVLRGMDVDVAGGEVVGLIGPNGSGKTTVVRVASRTLRPDAGTVLVEGRDPYAMGAREAARLLAVVPQEVTPTFAFSVLEVVLMGRAPHRGRDAAEDYRAARSAAEVAQVQHLAERTLDELSGGEKQRVLLAQALAQDAPVLLLDEPTTHLDVRHIVGILDVVRSLAAGGRAVLAIFHDLNLAAAYCDRLVAMADGRVVAAGPPGEVVTEALVHDLYGVDAEVHPHRTTGRPTVTVAPPPAGSRAGVRPRAHVVGGAGRGAPVMRALLELGYEVTAGVLHATDTDAEVAERLNLERVVVPPFSEIAAASQDEVVAMMERASIVVVTDAPYGPGNVGNLDAVARVSGPRLVLLGAEPIADRDFTGGRAAERWRSLQERGEPVRTLDELRALAAY